MTDDDRRTLYAALQSRVEQADAALADLRAIETQIATKVQEAGRRANSAHRALAEFERADAARA